MDCSTVGSCKLLDYSIYTRSDIINLQNLTAVYKPEVMTLQNTFKHQRLCCDLETLPELVFYLKDVEENYNSL